MALIAKAGHQCNLSRFQVLSKQFLSFADPYCFQVTIRRDTFRFVNSRSREYLFIQATAASSSSVTFLYNAPADVLLLCVQAGLSPR